MGVSSICAAGFQAANNNNNNNNNAGAGGNNNNNNNNNAAAGANNNNNNNNRSGESITLHCTVKAYPDLVPAQSCLHTCDVDMR